MKILVGDLFAGIGGIALGLKKAGFSIIWAKVQENAMFILRPKLFGFIPLGKIKQKGIRPQGLLRYCPFVTFKAKLEI